MTYINNQYIRLDKPLEEIAKIEIITDDKNKLIEDLEIEMKGGEYSNMVIAYGNKVEYNNIFTSIKVLITDETAIIKNEYKIPEYIEKIIVYGYVYENNNRGKERLKDGLKNGKELIDAVYEYNIKLASELLELEEININYVNKNGNTALICACYYNMETVSLKLLERGNININQVNKNDNTALIYACCGGMERVPLKLLEREKININHVGFNGFTALIWACMYKMESVALKLLEREKININKYGCNSTVLFWVYKNRMERVALKLLEREEININQVNKNGESALILACRKKWNLWH